MNYSQCIGAYTRWRAAQVATMARHPDHFMAFTGRMARVTHGDMPDVPADRLTDEFRYLATHSLVAGEPFIVRGQAAALILHSAGGVPDGLTLRRQLFPTMEGALFFAGQSQSVVGADEQSLSTISWHTSPDAAAAVMFGYSRPTDGKGTIPSPIVALRWQYGKRVIEPGEVDVEPVVIQFERVIMAALLFMEDKIIVPERPNRGERRQCARMGKGPVGKVFVLRSIKRARRGAVGTSSKLSERHVRSGHWHRFWIKSGHQRHDPTGPEDQLYAKWLLPTIVGDASLPLRPDAERVFDVRR